MQTVFLLQRWKKLFPTATVATGSARRCPSPDGSEPPGIPATGSGVTVIEGRAVVPLGDEGETERVPLTNVHSFFSIDEANGRVTVIINIFGRSTPVEFEHWQVEAV